MIKSIPALYERES